MVQKPQNLAFPRLQKPAQTPPRPAFPRDAGSARYRCTPCVCVCVCLHKVLTQTPVFVRCAMKRGPQRTRVPARGRRPTAAALALPVKRRGQALPPSGWRKSRQALSQKAHRASATKCTFQRFPWGGEHLNSSVALETNTWQC